MTAIVTEDQEECNRVIDALNMRSALVPRAPGLTCDGLCQIENRCWIIGTNFDNKRYRLVLLMDADKTEAWRMFDQISGPSFMPRLEIINGDCPANN